MSKLFDGYKFEAGEPEGAAGDQLFEFRYSHLVQAPGHVAESCCPICLKSGTPTDKGLLAEH